MDGQAFQDMQHTKCWGCGPQNEQGLQIKSYWGGEEAVCTWQPRSYHGATPEFLNGGVISTLIDCHSLATAMSAAYQAEGRKIGTGSRIGYVTGSLQVKFLRPISLKVPVELYAKVNEQSERKSIVACSVFSEGQRCAQGEVIALRVS